MGLFETLGLTQTYKYVVKGGAFKDASKAVSTTSDLVSGLVPLNVFQPARSRTQSRIGTLPSGPRQVAQFLTPANLTEAAIQLPFTLLPAAKPVGKLLAKPLSKLFGKGLAKAAKPASGALKTGATATGKILWPVAKGGLAGAGLVGGALIGANLAQKLNLSLFGKSGGGGGGAGGADGGGSTGPGGPSDGAGGFGFPGDAGFLGADAGFGAGAGGLGFEEPGLFEPGGFFIGESGAPSIAGLGTAAAVGLGAAFLSRRKRSTRRAS